MINTKYRYPVEQAHVYKKRPEIIFQRLDTNEVKKRWEKRLKIIEDKIQLHPSRDPKMVRSIVKNSESYNLIKEVLQIPAMPDKKLKKDPDLKVHSVPSIYRLHRSEVKKSISQNDIEQITSEDDVDNIENESNGSISEVEDISDEEIAEIDKENVSEQNIMDKELSSEEVKISNHHKLKINKCDFDTLMDEINKCKYVASEQVLEPAVSVTSHDASIVSLRSAMSSMVKKKIKKIDGKEYGELDPLDRCAVDSDSVEEPDLDSDVEAEKVRTKAWWTELCNDYSKADRTPSRVSLKQPEIKGFHSEKSNDLDVRPPTPTFLKGPSDLGATYNLYRLLYDKKSNVCPWRKTWKKPKSDDPIERLMEKTMTKIEKTTQTFVDWIRNREIDRGLRPERIIRMFSIDYNVENLAPQSFIYENKELTIIPESVAKAYGIDENSTSMKKGAFTRQVVYTVGQLHDSSKSQDKMRYEKLLNSYRESQILPAEIASGAAMWKKPGKIESELGQAYIKFLKENPDRPRPLYLVNKGVFHGKSSTANKQIRYVIPTKIYFRFNRKRNRRRRL